MDIGHGIMCEHNIILSFPQYNNTCKPAYIITRMNKLELLLEIREFMIFRNIN